MRKVLMPLWAVGTILFALPAYAETDRGVVDAFDVESGILILNQTMAFIVSEEVALPDLNAGDVVFVDQYDLGDAKFATQVTLPE